MRNNELTILPFAPNRVLRLYLGGSGIDRLCGVEPAEDSRYPENWIASCIEGNGRAYHSPGHGISKIRLGDGCAGQLSRISGGTRRRTAR